MRKIWLLQFGLAAVATLPAAQPTLTTLYTFTDTAGDGARPSASVVIGPGGVLYGTTYTGGTAGFGTVYSVTPPSAPGGSWTETVLYQFTGGNDGSNPGSLALGATADGRVVLYGTTVNGGASNDGVVYSLTQPESAGDAWTQQTLRSFNVHDGALPVAGVTMGPNGVLFGVTQWGGTGTCRDDHLTGCGTVYALTPPAAPGGAWNETVLHSFSGSEGQLPAANLVIDTNGVLYGTTQYGGTDASACGKTFNGCGTVFSMTPPASPEDSWTFNTLLEFNGTSGGRLPGNLVMGAGGVLYGSSYNNVYSLTPPAAPGGAWTETVLQDFSVPSSSGASPQGLVITPSGVLYGVTFDGGKYAAGSVFSLTPPASSGGAWTLHSIWAFNTDSPTYIPAGLTLSGSGKQTLLYGTTSGSISIPNSFGSVFSLQP